MLPLWQHFGDFFHFCQISLGLPMPSLVWPSHVYVRHFMYGRGENSGKKKLQEVVDISWKDFVGLGLIVLMAWFWIGVFPVRPLVILTGSMEPKIMPGDVVLIEKMQKEEDIQKLSEGDIINFDRDDKINITHRIKKVKN